MNCGTGTGYGKRMENLKHGKENAGNRSIEETIVMLKNTQEAVYRVGYEPYGGDRVSYL